MRRVASCEQWLHANGISQEYTDICRSTTLDNGSNLNSSDCISSTIEQQQVATQFITQCKQAHLQSMLSLMLVAFLHFRNGEKYQHSKNHETEAQHIRDAPCTQHSHGAFHVGIVGVRCKANVHNCIQLQNQFTGLAL